MTVVAVVVAGAIHDGAAGHDMPGGVPVVVMGRTALHDIDLLRFGMSLGLTFSFNILVGFPCTRRLRRF